jgi:hypothetical protein
MPTGGVAKARFRFSEQESRKRVKVMRADGRMEVATGFYSYGKKR